MEEKLTTEQVQEIRADAASAALHEELRPNPHPPESPSYPIWARHFSLTLNAKNE